MLCWVRSAGSAMGPEMDGAGERIPYVARKLNGLVYKVAGCLESVKKSFPNRVQASYYQCDRQHTLLRDTQCHGRHQAGSDDAAGWAPQSAWRMLHDPSQVFSTVCTISAYAAVGRRVFSNVCFLISTACACSVATTPCDLPYLWLHLLLSTSRNSAASPPPPT